MTISRMLILSVFILSIVLCGTSGMVQTGIIDNSLDPVYTDYTITPIAIINDSIKEIVLDEPPIPIEYLDRVDGWTCFDYSIKLNRVDPAWGIVLISHNPKFEGYAYGDNHMVNYKINVDKSLLIHDELLQREYIVSGWEYDSDTFDYYHFYINGEVPTRTWTRNAIKPNAGVVYNAL